MERRKPERSPAGIPDFSMRSQDNEIILFKVKSRIRFDDDPGLIFLLQVFDSVTLLIVEQRRDAGMRADHDPLIL
jgi:hypothetical protein